MLQHAESPSQRFAHRHRVVTAVCSQRQAAYIVSVLAMRMLLAVSTSISWVISRLSLTARSGKPRSSSKTARLFLRLFHSTRSRMSFILSMARRQAKEAQAASQQLLEVLFPGPMKVRVHAHIRA